MDIETAGKIDANLKRRIERRGETVITVECILEKALLPKGRKGLPAP